MKLMTVDEAFNHAMNEYPILWISPNLDIARLKFYDHIFNVNGNGYRNLEDFIEKTTINKSNQQMIYFFPEKYLGDVELFQVYLKRGIYDFTINNVPMHFEPRAGGMHLPDLYTLEETQNIPKTASVISAYSTNNNQPFVPYPNFSKDYSMVWRMDMSGIDISWLKAAKMYYEGAKDFFNSSDVVKYHGACPEDERALQKRIDELDNAFNVYRKDTMSDAEFYEAITKAYEQEYTGDTQAFIQNSWRKELSRIKDFLDETLIHLDELLQKRQTPKLKR